MDRYESACPPFLQKTTKRLLYGHCAKTDIKIKSVLETMHYMTIRECERNRGICIKIHKLSLNNFMVFEQAETDWSKNINVICTENRAVRNVMDIGKWGIIMIWKRRKEQRKTAE